MRHWLCHRILRCVQIIIADKMKLSGGHLVAALVLGVIIPITIITTYIGTFTTFKFNVNEPTSSLTRVEIVTGTPLQRHIKHQCQRYNRSTNLDTVNTDFFQHILVDDEHKLIYCQIPKVATTTWRRIFIILTGKAGTTDMMSLAPNDVHHKHDQLLTYLSDLNEEEIKHRLRTYFKFVFVREPFERVLSAFRNKFETTYTPMSYFQNAFGRKIIRRYRPKDNIDLKDLEKNPKITFGEFIDYLVDPKQPIAMNEHWEQFYKLCHPCVVDYDFIGKLESIQEDSDFLLQKSGLSSLIKFPSRTDARYKYRETNTFLKQYYSRVSKSKLQQLLDSYQEDFDLFNYTLPEDVKALIN